MSATAHRHAHDSGGEARTFGQPAPCVLYVGDTPIDEAEIAREMQHHRSARPAESRAAAARALVVRELLRREIDRLGLAVAPQSQGAEAHEEAGIRMLLERELVDRVPTEDVLRFEHELLEFLRRSHAGILDGIRETQAFGDDAEAELVAAYDEFLGQFETSSGQPIKAGREEVEALPEDDIEQEQIVKQKRG